MKGENMENAIHCPKIVSREKIPVIYENEMRFGFSDGVSVYRGVLIAWDSDHDTRVLDYIDKIPECYRRGLVAVHERKGGIVLVWKDHVSFDYEKSFDFECSDGSFDCWEPENIILKT